MATDMVSKMRIDVHCHVVGKGLDINDVAAEVYFNPEDNQHWFTRILYSLIEGELVKTGDSGSDGLISTCGYLELIYRLLVSSKEINGIVLLALDAVYDDGTLNKVKTDLWVSNKFLAKTVGDLNALIVHEGYEKIPEKRFYAGASVNPNGPHAMEELSEVIANPDSVLIKWIPSVQHIDVGKVDKKFYLTLAESAMPLLCHVGPEYSFPEGIRERKKDDFRFLRRPLDLGVKVIAAHCASPVFPIKDPNRMEAFRRLMDKYNTADDVRLWGDTSALSLSTRLPIIPQILELFPAKWLVHGTDFPIPIDSWPHLPIFTEGITPVEYGEIIRTRNPFDMDVKIKRAHGFEDSILENATHVLRLLT